jgi:two-component system cell cycle response regulator
MDVDTWSRKKMILTLRWLLVITISYMVIFGVPFPGYWTEEFVLVAFLVVSNGFLSILPKRFFGSRAMGGTLLIVDTVTVSIGIYLSRSASSDFYIVYFLVILLASLGGNMRRVILNALFVVVAYTALLASTGPREFVSEPTIMIRIPFIVSLSLFYGYILERERNRVGRVEKLEKENRDLEALIDISRLVASTLEAEEVLKLLVRKVEGVLRADRCSVIFIKEGDTRVGYVMASHDDPEISRLEIDLNKYPEVQRAMETGNTVVIRDALKDPLVREFGEEIQKAGFKSLLVVPMAHGDEAFGTLLLRAARARDGFSEWEIKFCQIVANTSANALKNAELFQKLKRQAITDGMTEMYNHRFFQEQFRVQAERTKRTGRPLSVLMIDIDNFKWINDYYGHAVGDRAICFVADKLRANSREGDVVARYGGDEFVWLLCDTDLEDAVKVANRFRRSITENPFETTGFLSVSVGVATYPTDTPSIARLLQQADRAMYLSKGEGGNRVRSVMNHRAPEVLDWGERR